MKDLGSRLVSSCVSLTLLTALILFAFNPYIRFVVAACVALLAVIGVWEYEQLAKAKGGKMPFSALAPLTAVIVFSFFVESEWLPALHLSLIALFLSASILFFLHFREKQGAIFDLAISVFSLFYLAVPMGMMLGILFMSHGQDGRIWLAYLLAVTKVTDIGAYFVGGLWGKRKLVPIISPGKTVEGALFGWICAVAMSFGFYLLGQFLGPSRFHLSFFASLGLGAILGVASQFGDLSESLLKRDADKKDSNKLPGIGGVLDLVDSLLFNAPILYIYLL